MAHTGQESRVLAEWGEAEAGPMNGESGRLLAEQLVRIVAGISPRASICDLGCGNGYLASRLAPLGGRIVGVDASQRLLRVAREHYQSDRIEFRQGLFGEELAASLAGHPFDLVVSCDVVEHLYHPMSLIDTADRILKPGGRLVIGTPYHGYLKNVAISVLGRWDAHHTVHWDGGHVKFFSRATLATLVSRRFDIDRFEYYGRVPWLWKNMICIATKRA